MARIQGLTCLQWSAYCEGLYTEVLHVRRSGPLGAREAGKIFESPIAVGWRSAGSPAEKKADYAARIVLCAFAAILWLMFAAEARAQDGPASSGEGAPAAGGGASAEEESPAPDPTTGPGVEVPTPPADDPVEQPPPSPPPADEAPPASPPPAPPAESPQAPPATPEPPPAQPPASPPAPNPPLGVGETPSPGPPSTPPGPVPVPLVSPDAVVTPPPSGELAGVQPLSDGEESAQAPAASRGGSIVEIRPDGLPSLLSTDARGRLAAVALTTNRLGVHSGSRSNTQNEVAPGAKSAGDAPLLPSWPLGDQAPSTPYASTGGAGGGSPGGFFAWVVAGLIGLLAAAAQRLGSLVPLTLSPPRCTAYVFGLERPD
jgi:hypothetical protein